jgi:multidrug efflux pump subunit AcrA (membrane-fusion protein)
VPQADERSRTFPVIVRLTNPEERGEHLLKAGMLARVILGVGQQQVALMVPKDALVLNGPLSSVVVADGGSANLPSTARVVPVELGIAEDDLIQIIDRMGTLKPGQSVVVRGNERLRTGQPIQVVPSFSEPPPAEGTRR